MLYLKRKRKKKIPVGSLLNDANKSMLNVSWAVLWTMTHCLLHLVSSTSKGQGAASKQTPSSVCCPHLQQTRLSFVFLPWWNQKRQKLSLAKWSCRSDETVFELCRCFDSVWLTCSLSSVSWPDRLDTSFMVDSSFSCRFLISFCSPSASLLTRDMARIRGNQSRLCSWGNDKYMTRCMKHSLLLKYLWCCVQDLLIFGKACF